MISPPARRVVLNPGLLWLCAGLVACGDSEGATTGEPTTQVTTASSTVSSTGDSEATTAGPTDTGPTTDPSTSSGETTGEPTTDPSTTDSSGDPSTDPSTDPTTGNTSDTGDTQTTGQPPDLVTTCLFVHRGGVPASVTSVRLDPDASMAELESIELSGGHSPVASDYRRDGIVTCGDRLVHAAMMDTDQVATIAVDYFGSMTVLETTAVPNVEGLLCDEEHEVLFAYGRNAGDGFLRTFTIEGDDTLLLSDNVDLNFKYDGMLQLYADLHPTEDILYVAGKTTGMVNSEVEVHKIDYGANAKVVLDSLTPTGGSLLLGFSIAPSGDEMAFVAWSGGLAWHNLPPTGDVPPAQQLTIINDPAWQGGNDIVIRGDLDSDERFYYAMTTGAGVIRIAEFQGQTLAEFGMEASAAKRSHLQLAHDDTILLAISQAGMIKAFSADNEGIVLTEVGTLNVGGAAAQASALMPCAP